MWRLLITLLDGLFNFFYFEGKCLNIELDVCMWLQPPDKEGNCSNCSRNGSSWHSIALLACSCWLLYYYCCVQYFFLNRQGMVFGFLFWECKTDSEGNGSGKITPLSRNLGTSRLPGIAFIYRVFGLESELSLQKAITFYNIASEGSEKWLCCLIWAKGFPPAFWTMEKYNILHSLFFSLLFCFPEVFSLPQWTVFLSLLVNFSMDFVL